MMEVFEELESWAAFVEMRRAKGKRAPFTARAKERILMELKRLHESGQDVDKCLWISVMNGWSGVFPVRGAQSAPVAQAGFTTFVPRMSAVEFERSMAAKRAALARMQQALPGRR
jgi:hypothetical protein